ncbi:aminotransferase class I/II-fold pyridoxal phosphate-dependent enzyme [Kordiimonas laminariae]|uniref:aminotransferase class I/II-fold pyridoxal phosphate-dependent enzyme n=1 Tax=Kordiimonas laminariae TaxID=2917717 RepID=UPI001FF11A4B|nr:aminotransferase class I/II-fold pyridoxal phosphate-dependent enzyme [Kordiimonas laminariae]
MIPSIHHGGDMRAVKAQYPHLQEGWLDLSTGLSPFIYPWQEKIAAADLYEASSKLPQTSLIDTCGKAWSRYLGIKDRTDWLVTAGSQAIINIMPQLLPEYQAVIPVPNYGEHARVWSRSARPAIMLEREVLKSFEYGDQQVVFLTSPNNPDGYIWSKEVIWKAAKQLKEKRGYLLLDEAFADVAFSTSIVTEDIPDNMILLRSFGKFFGLAGVRLGYAKLPADLKGQAQAILGPWSVNGLAALIAFTALRDDRWIQDTRMAQAKGMVKLKTILEGADFEIIGGTDLFCLGYHKDTDRLTEQLNGSAIHIRRFEEYPNWIRFGLPASEKEFNRLREALYVR